MEINNTEQEEMELGNGVGVREQAVGGKGGFPWDDCSGFCAENWQRKPGLLSPLKNTTCSQEVLKR
jgi:hypothetical protein